MKRIIIPAIVAVVLGVTGAVAAILHRRRAANET